MARGGLRDAGSGHGPNRLAGLVAPANLAGDPIRRPSLPQGGGDRPDAGGSNGGLPRSEPIARRVDQTADLSLDGGRVQRTPLRRPRPDRVKHVGAGPSTSLANPRVVVTGTFDRVAPRTEEACGGSHQRPVVLFHVGHRQRQIRAAPPPNLRSHSRSRPLLAQSQRHRVESCLAQRLSPSAEENLGPRHQARIIASRWGVPHVLAGQGSRAQPRKDLATVEPSSEGDACRVDSGRAKGLGPASESRARLAQKLAGASPFLQRAVVQRFSLSGATADLQNDPPFRPRPAHRDIAADVRRPQLLSGSIAEHVRHAEPTLVVLAGVVRVELSVRAKMHVVDAEEVPAAEQARHVLGVDIRPNPRQEAFPQRRTTRFGRRPA